MSREIEVLVRKPERIKKCPKCSNNTYFKAKVEQVAEDLCNVWVECVCGYDPTSENTSYRYEDIWGELSRDTVDIALDCWNDALMDASNTSACPK